jgi:type 2 lantibiotic biosynthesis protein LanM
VDCSAEALAEASRSLLGWGASPVSERLAQPVAPPSTRESDRLRLRWTRIAFDDRDDAEDLLTLRLAAVDQRPPGQVLDHLAGRPAPADLPAWWHYLREGLEPDRFDFASVLAKPVTSSELAFQRDMVGLAQRGWRDLTSQLARLDRSTGRWDWLDLDSLKPSLLAALSVSLAQKVDRTLVLELNIARLEKTLTGDTAEERYRDFSRRLAEGELESILLRYPPLGRLLATTIQCWVTVTLEMFLRLSQDISDVETTLHDAAPLGCLTELRGGLSDPHRGHRSVAELRFSTGARIMYKPRPLEVDSAFHQLVGTLNAWGLEPSLPTRRHVARDRYGWDEFVAHRPCPDTAAVARFYRRHGVYLMLMYLLGGTDFHRENVIADADQPIFVDLEALFHQPASKYPAESSGAALRIVDESVLGTYLLPLWVNGPEGAIELGGLGGVAGQTVPHQVPAWVSPASDEMREGRVTVTIGGAANLPVLDGRAVGPEGYLAEIASGFRATYDLILAHRDRLRDPAGPLHAFAALGTRHIMRPTQIYYRLLRDSVHPDHLQDAVRRDMLLDRLWLIRASADLDSRIIIAETDDLRRGDIPAFTTRPDSRSVWASDGREIDEYFEESGLSRALARLEGLHEKDRNRQLALIESAMATKTIGRRDLAAPSAHGAAQLPDPLGHDELLDAARGIGDRLEELAFLEGGEAVWVGFTVTRDERWTLAPVGRDLYAGTAGIALFLAYLGLSTADERYLALGRQALNFTRGNLRAYVSSAPVGGFSGSASVLHALATLSGAYDDPSLLDLALDLIDALAPAVKADEAFDLLGGCAGAIPVLLRLAELTGDSGCSALAYQCGERLLDAAVPTGNGMIGWPSAVAQSPLAGFAHGAAGIAWALLELYGASGDDRFAAAAQAALAYEATLFDPERRTWLDRRPEPDGPPGAPVAWCHGAPGVGLGRILSLPFDDTPVRRSELTTALTTTAHLGRATDHSLCHGDLGHADILLLAAEVLDQPEHRTVAQRLAAGAVRSWQADRSWQCGVPEGVETPGLFLGLAGIGYGLLRVRDPQLVPSAVALGFPHARKGSSGC